MSVGEYVSLRNKNRIIVGLVEDVDDATHTTLVRVRENRTRATASSPSVHAAAAPADRPDVLRVPSESLELLGVRKNRVDPSSGEKVSSSSSSQMRGSSTFDPTAPAGNSSINNDQGGIRSSNDMMSNKNNYKNSDSDSDEDDDPVLRQYRERNKKNFRAGLYQHGICSKYLWEFVSPLAALLRCERPFFVIGLVLIFAISEGCRTHPETVKDAACSLFGTADQLYQATATGGEGTAATSKNTMSASSGVDYYLLKFAFLMESWLSLSPTTSSLSILCDSRSNKSTAEYATALQRFSWTVSMMCAFCMFCLFWSLGANSHLPPLSRRKKHSHHHHRELDDADSASLQDEQLDRDTRREYYLLDDCESDTDFEVGEEGEDVGSASQLARSLLSTTGYGGSLSNAERQRLRALETEVYYPDVALARFIAEFRSLIKLHLIVIFIASIFCALVGYTTEDVGHFKGWFVQEVEKTEMHVIYRHEIIRAAMAPVESYIKGLIEACKYHPSLEHWLIVSIGLNAVAALVAKVIKYPFRKK